MWRPAVLRFGMLGILGVACSGGSKSNSAGDTTIGNRGALVSNNDDMTASYWCSITSGEYTYPQMPCVIRQVDGRYMLAKLAGSQRFRGVVRKKGEFVPTADGKLRGMFSNSIVVTMTRAPEGSAAFGGTGYGGDSYGGFGYGGASYGGATYAVPPKY
jgi:uncharacterized membrane protein YgcG